MTDTSREFVLAGDHAENLHSGAMLAPGDRVNEADLADEDRWLIQEERLLEVEPPATPTVGAQRARAKDLGIEGASSMSAGKLTKAIEEAEGPIVRAAKRGVAEGDVREEGDR